MLTETEIDALLNVTGNDAEFAHSLWSGYQKYGSLTSRQEPYARNMIRGTGIQIADEAVTFERPQFDPTASQQAALDGVMEAIAQGEPVIGLTGAAGTGKSFLTTWLAYRFPKSIQFAAPTHPAKGVLLANGLPALTVHKMCGLRPHDDHTKGYVASGQSQLLANGLLVVDEASMVDAAMINAILTRQAAKGPSATLILLGDASQLPPVAGGPMFTDFLSDIGAPVFELTEVLRNGGPIAEMLVDYRVGEDAAAAWPDKVVEYGDREATLQAHLSGDYGDSCFVAYTNSVVDATNARGRAMTYGADVARANPYMVGEPVLSNSSVIDPKSQKVILENGQTGTVGAVRDGPVKGSYWVSLNLDSPNEDQKLSRGGATVLCAQGLAKEGMLGKLSSLAESTHAEYLADLNAAYGAGPVRAFKESLGVGDLKKLLAAEEPDPEIRGALIDLDKARRAAWVDYYRAKNGIADLRPLWARTVHKAQGMTVDTVIVDQASIDSARGDWRPLVYVAMSRARSRIILV